MDNQDRALRPIRLADFRGQEQIKENLKIAIFGAKTRGESLDHVGLFGPAGHGKTTLSEIIANELGSKLTVVNAPTLKTKGEMASLLSSMNRNDILFLDEIHGINPKIEEILYPAMEDYKLEIVAGNHAVTIKLEPFTLIGATTRPGMLQKPLRDRFGLVFNMKPYSDTELSEIIKENTKKLNLSISEDGIMALAMRSRGTPRIANRTLRRVRDFAQWAGLINISSGDINSICSSLGIDSKGLDSVSRRYIEILVEKSQPVSLNTMASLLGETKDTIEEYIEPYLVQIGMVEKTSKGRIATKTAYCHVRSV